jgi:hypothetical protein
MKKFRIQWTPIDAVIWVEIYDDELAAKVEKMFPCDLEELPPTVKELVEQKIADSLMDNPIELDSLEFAKKT